MEDSNSIRRYSLIILKILIAIGIIFLIIQNLDLFDKVKEGIEGFYSFKNLPQGYKFVISFLIFSILTIVVLEIFLISNQEPNDEVNYVLHHWSNKYYSLVFAWGVIGAHLFFGSSNSYNFSNVTSLISVVIATLFLVALDFFKRNKEEMPTDKKAWVLIAGFIVGHFLWSMNTIL